MTAANRPPPPPAEAQAMLARLWDDTDPAAGRWPSVVMLPAHPAARPGWTVWGVLGASAVTVLPELLPGAPPEVHRRYLARVIAALAGRCPLCREAAGLSADPSTPGAWHGAPLTIRIPHPPGCAALFTEDDRQYFDPRAIGRNRGAPAETETEEEQP